jgi:hypothetical protein
MVLNLSAFKTPDKKKEGLNLSAFDAAPTSAIEPAQTTIGPKPQSFAERVFSKLPERVQDIGRSIKEGFLGSQEPDITTGKLRETGGLLRRGETEKTKVAEQFIPFHLLLPKSKQQKYFETFDSLKPLVDSGQITSQRADEIAQNKIRPTGIRAVGEGLKPVRPKLNLTRAEEEALKPLRFEERLDKVFGSIDFTAVGSLKGVGKTVIQKVAKSRSAQEINNILTKELPDLAEDFRSAISKFLVGVDDASEVQKVFNRAEFTAKGVGEGAGVAPRKGGLADIFGKGPVKSVTPTAKPVVTTALKPVAVGQPVRTFDTVDEFVQARPEVTPEISDKIKIAQDTIKTQETIKAPEVRQDQVIYRDDGQLTIIDRDIYEGTKDFVQEPVVAVVKIDGTITDTIPKPSPTDRLPIPSREPILPTQLKAVAKEALPTPLLQDRKQLEVTPQTLQKARLDAVSQIESKVSSLPKTTVKKDLSQGQTKSNDITPDGTNTKTVPNDWRGVFKLPKETKLQATRRTVEDFNIRLKVLNDEIEKVAGKKINESFDLWAQKDMLPRKQSDLLRRTREKKQDFVERLIQKNIKVQELDDYMHARHAVERNAKMNVLRKEKGKPPVDGLSGMTDVRAKEILSKDAVKYKPFEIELQQIIKETLDFQVAEGLLKASDADVIRKSYKNYVPLFRDVGDDAIGIGAGIDIKGKEIKKAVGSVEKRALSPTGNIFFQQERAQIRALKNNVGKTIVSMTDDMPELKDLFEIEKQKFLPRFNADGELQFLDPKFKMGDNVLGTKIEGTQYFITVKDKKTAQALKNLNIARIPKAMQYARSVLGIWSSLKTRWRPEFLITNFQRDLGEALVNLNVEKTILGPQGKNLKKKIIRDLFPSQRKIWKYLRGGKDPQVDEFFELGGDAGHFWLEGVEKAEISLKGLEKQLENKGIEKILNPIRKSSQLVDDINSMVELGVRYSTYKNLLAAGMSKQKSIQATADLTLNFSRQGELSPVMKSLYGFINPTIQGLSKAVRTMTSKTGRARVMKSLFALMALGFMTRASSMAIDPEGDEQISEWDKNHKLSIAIGNGKVIKLWSMPYGFTTFYSMGSNGAELVFGKKTPREALGEVFSTAINSFSPFGTQLNDFVPTLARPIFDINNNKGWYDGKIHPEQIFTKTPKPNAETYFNNATESSKFIASYLNKVTGGGDGKSGLIDVSPNDLKYLFDQYVGGPFEFAMTSIEAGAYGAEGKFDPNKTPFVRQFFRNNKPDSWAYGTIYDTLERAYKKDLTDLEKDRFYRAVDTGVSEEIFDQKKADGYVQDFLKAQYKIVGSVTGAGADATIEQIKSIPPEDRERLLNTYGETTQKRLRRELRKASGSRPKLGDSFNKPKLGDSFK